MHLLEPATLQNVRICTNEAVEVEWNEQRINECTYKV